MGGYGLAGIFREGVQHVKNHRLACECVAQGVDFSEARVHMGAVVCLHDINHRALVTVIAQLVKAAFMVEQCKVTNVLC